MLTRRRGAQGAAAAWAAAILLDLGLDPDHIEVANAWVSVCIYGPAAFSHAHGVVAPAAIAQRRRQR